MAILIGGRAGGIITYFSLKHVINRQHPAPMYRLLILLVVVTTTAFRFIPTPPVDGLTGTWKRTSMLLVEASGKTSDMAKQMEQAMPCSKDLTYSFTADGHMKTNVPDACGSMKKTIESMSAAARWTMAGRKVTVTTTIKELPTATYDVSFQGNKMTWVFIYAENPQTPNPTKAQRMTTVYQRI